MKRVHATLIAGLLCAGCGDGGAPEDLGAPEIGDAAITTRDGASVDAALVVADAAVEAPDAAARPIDVAYTGSAATTGQGQGAGALNIGREFAVTRSGIVIEELGFWDQAQDGLAAAHTVTLFALDKTGAGARATPVPGGSLVVPAGAVAALDNGFRFARLAAPLPLAQGSYAVVGYGFSASDPYGDGGDVPLSATGVADAQFDPYQLTSDSSPAFPNGGDGVNHTSVSFRYQSGAAAFVRIMPFGDSITYGVGGSNAGYRSFLGALLAQQGISYQFVGSISDNPGMLAADQMHHEGHPGYVIESGSSGRAGLADSLAAWLGAGGVAPDVILLMIGTNDIDVNYDNANVGKRLDAFISRISDRTSGLRPDADLVVAQIVKIGDATEDARAQTYNAQIATIVANHKAAGERVSVVDMHTPLDAGDFSDKLHPNDSGYGKMAQVWLNAILGL
jgi:lysophospholipase L1-like esterase